MRMQLTHKLVVAFALVALVALAVPPLLEQAGLDGWLAHGLAALAAALVAWLCSFPLVRNFRALRDCTDLIGRGDLTAAVEVGAARHFPDETVDLARSVRSMLDSLRELVDQVQRAAAQVAECADELSDSSRNACATHQGISDTVRTVATGTAKQREDVEHSVARMHEIAEALKGNADAARAAFGLSTEASQRATAGAEISRTTVEKLQSLFVKIEQASGLVMQFEEKIRFVHRITEMITYYPGSDPP